MKTETIYTGAAHYLGKTMCGFINDNSYDITITKGLYGYTVQDSASGYLQYASEMSIKRNWELKGEINND